MNKIIFYGIDCHISEDEFPKPHHLKDIILNISILTFDHGTLNKTIITILDINPIDDTKIIKKKNEIELLTEFCNFVNNFKPELITGYNIFGFHNVYLYTRILVNNLKSNLGNITFLEKKEKSAMGDNNQLVMFCGEAKSIDIYVMIKSKYNLKNYRFYYAVKEILGEGDDMVVFDEDERKNIIEDTIENKTIFCQGNMHNVCLQFKLFMKIAVEK